VLVVVDRITGERWAAACAGNIAITSAARRVTGIESLLVGRSFRCERAASDNYHAGETRSSRRAYTIA
jgi:hypothetical protein